MVQLTDHPAMTIAVDLGRKATKQTNNRGVRIYFLKKKNVFFCLKIFLYLNKQGRP